MVQLKEKLTDNDFCLDNIIQYKFLIILLLVYIL